MNKQFSIDQLSPAELLALNIFCETGELEAPFFERFTAMDLIVDNNLTERGSLVLAHGEHRYCHGK